MINYTPKKQGRLPFWNLSGRGRYIGYCCPCQSLSASACCTMAWSQTTSLPINRVNRKYGESFKFMWNINRDECAGIFAIQFVECSMNDFATVVLSFLIMCKYTIYSIVINTFLFCNNISWYQKTERCLFNKTLRTNFAFPKATRDKHTLNTIFTNGPQSLSTWR